MKFNINTASLLLPGTFGAEGKRVYYDFKKRVGFERSSCETTKQNLNGFNCI